LGFTLRKRYWIPFVIFALLIGVLIGSMAFPQTKIKTETSSSLNNYIYERANITKWTFEAWNFTIEDRAFTPRMDISIPSRGSFAALARQYGIETIYYFEDHTDIIVKIYFWFGVVRNNTPIITYHRVW